MAHVERSASFDRAPQEIWGTIGDYGTVDSWHPAVAKCDREGAVRLLTLGDGGEIRETLTAEGPLTYSYRIDESPLPVTDYTATLSVAESGGGSEVHWSADFAAAGASEEEASEVIGGIFDAGLGAI